MLFASSGFGCISARDSDSVALTEENIQLDNNGDGIVNELDLSSVTGSTLSNRLTTSTPEANDTAPTELAESTEQSGASINQVPSASSADHDAHVSFLQAASGTATERIARNIQLVPSTHQNANGVTECGKNAARCYGDFPGSAGPFQTALETGNSFADTPSANLSIDDFVVEGTQRYSQILPRIRYRIFFDVKDFTTSTTEAYLSSDVDHKTGEVRPGGTTSHGDWFGAWNRETIDILLKNCIRPDRVNCDQQNLGDPEGRRFSYPARLGGRITPQQVLEYCPLRSVFDNKASSVAYCNQH